MDFFSAIRVALAALLVNKGRSVLTSLGIVIGISAVISMVSAGGGARQILDDRLDNVGKNLIVVKAGSHTQVGAIADLKTFSPADVAAVRKHAGPLVSGVAEVQVTQRVASTATHNRATVVVGTSPAMQAVRAWVVEHGRYFNDEDVKKQAAVCVLGRTVAQKLFPDQANPVGQIVRIDRLPLRVVGVLEPKGRSPTGGDQDDQIFLPLTTLQRKIVGEERVNSLLASVRSQQQIDPAKEVINKALREARHVKTGREDFDVSSVRELSELAVVFTRTMQILISVIAGISLVVGGIGIMNIMLVSVTERTREIGIRMAVGATPFDVLVQFLIEAVVLSLTGGLLGITVGIAAAVGLAYFFAWPVVIDPHMVLVSFAVSAGVGIFFGYYPAVKASRLDPIEALRYE
jgi:putative ABC transport system permease protein